MKKVYVFENHAFYSWCDLCNQVRKKQLIEKIQK